MITEDGQFAGLYVWSKSLYVRDLNSNQYVRVKKYSSAEQAALAFQMILNGYDWREVIAQQ